MAHLNGANDLREQIACFTFVEPMFLCDVLMKIGGVVRVEDDGRALERKNVAKEVQMILPGELFDGHRRRLRRGQQDRHEPLVRLETLPNELESVLFVEQRFARGQMTSTFEVVEFRFAQFVITDQSHGRNDTWCDRRWYC